MMTPLEAFRFHTVRPIFLVGIFTIASIGSSQNAPATTSSAKATIPVGSPNHYTPNRMPHRETEISSAVWGVDSFTVKSTESGELIRFSYRVVDGDRAKVLNDKKNEAYLISQDKHVKLVVPSLEKVGQLRQSSTPIQGNTYWMAFSNPGRPVKPGDRVDIEIGQFRVQGLLVQ